LRDAGVSVRDQAQLNGGQTYELWSVPAFECRDPEVIKGANIGSAKLRVRPGDVLICKINPRINRVWVVQSCGEHLEQIASPEWIVFRPDPAALDSEFVAYYLSGPAFREWIASSVRGATGSHSRARADDVLDQLVPLPPLPEQRRIVAILDEAFEGIAKARANAEKNIENARALFESHLDAVFSRRGPDWTDKRLEDVALDFGRGKSKHRPRNDPKLYGGRYPFIQTGDVRGSDHLITEFTQTYNEAGLAQSKLWPAGTLCITIAANIAETGILGFDACFPDSVIGVVVNPKVTSNSFLEYLLQSVKARLKAEGKGSGQDNINLGTFQTQTFPFPDLKTQTRLVESLDEVREGSGRLGDLFEQKLAALDELKKSLLHHAFAGEL
jgi:type I restriction enzyme S subunit